MNFSVGRLARRLGLYKQRRIGSHLVFRDVLLYDVWHEEHLRRLFEMLEVDCVFDVGANRGQYVELLRKGVGYHGLIISFEPIPKLAAELRSRSKNDPKWLIEELVLSEDDGHKTFNVMEVAEFSSLGTPLEMDGYPFSSMNRVRDSIVVNSESLSTALSRLHNEHGFQKPFLKLDTQGLDVAIVKAAADVIHQFVGLQVELSIKCLYEESVDYREALEVYSRCGFDLAMFMAINPEHFPRLFETDGLLVRRDLLRDL